MINHTSGVARCVPKQLSSATTANSATGTATENGLNARKAASIQELRAQLRAQQHRNIDARDAGPVAQQVAHISTVSESSCGSQPAWRAALVEEFMAIDGMTRPEAEAMAAISVQPRTPAYWMALIAELDRMIDAYCTSTQVTEQAKDRMRTASHSQSLASIPSTIDWFKNELQGVATTHKSKAQND